MLVTAGGFWLGYLRNQRLREQADILEEGGRRLEEAARMLLWQATPLPELMEGLSSTPGQLKGLFYYCWKGLNKEDREHSFSALWEQGVIEQCGLLSREEQRLLQTAGEMFGRYEREEQAGALKQLAAELRATAQQVRETQQRSGRMYCVLGGSVGLLLTIVLL